jgi:hypothetical protein
MVSTAIVELAVDQRPTVTTTIHNLPNLAPLSGWGISGAFGSCASIKLIAQMDFHTCTQVMLEGYRRTSQCHRACLVVPELSGKVVEVLVEYTRKRHPNLYSGERAIISPFQPVTENLTAGTFLHCNCISPEAPGAG